MGGFTTFSSFSKQTIDLLRQGFLGPALGYAALSMLLCLFAAWLGVLTAPNQPLKVQPAAETQPAE
jgi:CrcB protein